MSATRRTTDAHEDRGALHPAARQRDVANPMIFADDLLGALEVVRPTALAESTLDIPDLRLDDVGDMAEVKRALTETVLWPLSYPDTFARLGASGARAATQLSVPAATLAPAAAESDHVSLVSFELGTQEYALPLDRVQVANTLTQRPGDRTEPGSDLDHEIFRLRLDCIDDPADVAAIDQKVLTEAFARPVLRHVQGRRRPSLRVGAAEAETISAYRSSRWYSTYDLSRCCRTHSCHCSSDLR